VVREEHGLLLLRGWLEGSVGHALVFRGGTALRLLTSPVTPVSVLAQVATLERMWSGKQAALAGRRQARDLYALWFIAQRLRLPFEADLTGFDRQAIARELRKYLPKSQWPVIDRWSA
jgi:hypothetical protein